MEQVVSCLRTEVAMIAIGHLPHASMKIHTSSLAFVMVSHVCMTCIIPG